MGLAFVFIPGKKLTKLRAVFKTDSFKGPVAYIYFSIVKTQRIVPLNLPSVLVHILNRKEQQDEAEEGERTKENSQKFLQKTFALKTVFWLLPTTYPLGTVLKNMYVHCTVW